MDEEGWWKRKNLPMQDNKLYNIKISHNMSAGEISEHTIYITPS